MDKKAFIYETVCLEYISLMDRSMPVALAQQTARPVGRPRCMETHKAILCAAADLLESTCYRDISVERIAASAGVGKQTIYRWYDSKADLLLDAFLTRYTEALPPV